MPRIATIERKAGTDDYPEHTQVMLDDGTVVYMDRVSEHLRGLARAGHDLSGAELQAEFGWAWETRAAPGETVTPETIQYALGVMRVLRETPDEKPKVSSWSPNPRPIATAHRDGRRILVYVPPEKWAEDQRETRSGWFTAWWQSSGWMTGMKGHADEAGYIDEPTLWDDLPPDPAP